MRILLLTICGMFVVGELLAQIALPYSVDFTSRIPSNWYQDAGDPIKWEWSSHGKNAPGSAIVDLSDESARFVVRTETPSIDFSSASAPVLRFNAAFIRSNFMAPAISVWYRTGDEWRLLDTWGESSLADFTEVNHQVLGGSDYVPPLDAQNIVWHTLTADLTALAGQPDVKFAFQAEFPNGGYVLIDDVEFTSMIASVQDDYSMQSLTVFPNPATERLEIKSGKPFAHALIVDLLGRTVLNAETASQNLQLDIAVLPAGSYWLQLIDEEGFICGRRSFVKR